MVALLVFTGSAQPQPSLEQVKTDYVNARAEFQKHLVDERWIDDDPQSPKLLTEVWRLAAEWVARWLGEQPSATVDGVKTALRFLESSDDAESLALDDNTFLVAPRGPIGNVFVVAKTGDRYRVAWSTAQPQKSNGRPAQLLAAWRAENARLGGRGPCWAASGSAGSVIPRLGSLPKDRESAADSILTASVRKRPRDRRSTNNLVDLRPQPAFSLPATMP